MDGYKKASILYVLKVLEEYSDAEHLLTQQEIIDKIFNEYDLLLERKSVANSIQLLIDMGYDINKGERGGFYLLSRLFDKSEVQYLVDALFSSKTISGNQAKKLSDSISSTLSKYERKQYNYIYKSEDINRNINSDFFFNIELINEAIKNNKKISFKYISYDMNGKEKFMYDDFRYVVNPYYLINNYGKYYLLSFYEKWKNVSTYRIDYMRDIEVLEEDRIDERTIEEFKYNFNINDYINNHIYLFGGKIITATVLIEKESAVSYVIDWFNNNAKIYNRDGKIYAKIKCDDKAFFYWALQYSEVIKVISPADLKNKIIVSLKKTLKTYESLEVMERDASPVLDIKDLIKAYMYSINTFEGVNDYTRVDYIKKLEEYLKENVMDNYHVSSDDYSVSVYNNDNDEEKYIINFNYLYSDKDDNKIFNLLRNIKRMEESRMEEGYKAYSVLLTKNSTYYKSDEEGTVMDYFTKGKEIPSNTEIEIRNKKIAFERPHMIEWVAIPKTNLIEWYRYYIVEA